MAMGLKGKVGGDKEAVWGLLGESHLLLTCLQANVTLVSEAATWERTIHLAESLRSPPANSSHSLYDATDSPARHLGGIGISRMLQ